jgi:hypothetical protein
MCPQYNNKKVKKNEVLINVTTWMNLENIIQSERITASLIVCFSFIKHPK